MRINDIFLYCIKSFCHFPYIGKCHFQYRNSLLLATLHFLTVHKVLATIQFMKDKFWMGLKNFNFSVFIQSAFEFIHFLDFGENSEGLNANAFMI